jgi:hypothetical protein
MMTIFILSLTLLITVWTTSIDFSSYARCSNGYHKSPTGDCEKVIESSTNLPRCPNGFHRSPDGDCERVTGSTTSGSSGSSSSSSSSNSDSLSNQDSIFKDANNNNNLINNGQQQESEPQNNSSRSSNAITDSTTTTDNAVNNTSLTNPQAGKCDKSLWNHVYHPERLQIINACKSVLGTIESKKSEPDGDFHIRLKLDPQFSNLINSANVNGQRGDLVVEPICQHTITESIAAAVACSNFHQNINIPEVGSHVNVTGSYVLDKEHNGWAEIHPVTSIIKISM